MTCPDRREALLDLSLGLLPPAEARELEAHAAGCDACGRELRSLRATRRAMAALPEAPAPVHGEALLLAAARQAAERVRARRPAWRRAWLAGGTLGLAGATALVLVLVQSRGGPSLESGPAPAESAAPQAEPGARGVVEPPATVAAPVKVEATADTLAEVSPAAKSVGPPPAPAAARPERKKARAEEARAVARNDAFVGPSGAGASVAGAGAAAAPRPASPAVSSAPSPAPAEAGITAESAPARQVAAAALRADPAGARAVKVSAPDCRLEARRTFERDAGGRVVARQRVGRYPVPGTGDQPLTVEERFAPGGRLRSATVRVGDRLITVSEADIDAGRLEPLPGVVLAADAPAAERAPPRCDP